MKLRDVLTIAAMLLIGALYGYAARMDEESAQRDQMYLTGKVDK